MPISLLPLFENMIKALRSVNDDADPDQLPQLKTNHRQLKTEFEATAKHVYELIPEGVKPFAKEYWGDDLWYWLDTMLHYQFGGRYIAIEVDNGDLDRFGIQHYDDFVAKMTKLGKAWEGIVELVECRRLDDKFQACFASAELTKRLQESPSDFDPIGVCIPRKKPTTISAALAEAILYVSDLRTDPWTELCLMLVERIPENLKAFAKRKRWLPTKDPKDGYEPSDWFLPWWFYRVIKQRANVPLRVEFAQLNELGFASFEDLERKMSQLVTAWENLVTISFEHCPVQDGHSEYIKISFAPREPSH